MFSARPPISKSSSFLSKPLGTVPSALITNGIIVIFMFNSFLSSQARSKYLSLFLLSLISTQLVFYWSLSESKSPHVSRTLLNILANLNNVVVWMVSSLPLISSSFLSKPWWTVLSAPTTISITVTLMFHSFFSSLEKSKHLSIFLISSIFTLWSTGTTNSTREQVFSIFFFVVN